MIVSHQLHSDCRAIQHNTVKCLAVLQLDRFLRRALASRRLQGTQKADELGALLTDDIREGRHARGWNAPVQQSDQIVIRKLRHPVHNRWTELTAGCIGAMARCAPHLKGMSARSLRRTCHQGGRLPVNHARLQNSKQTAEGNRPKSPTDSSPACQIQPPSCFSNLRVLRVTNSTGNLYSGIAVRSQSTLDLCNRANTFDGIHNTERRRDLRADRFYSRKNC